PSVVPLSACLVRKLTARCKLPALQGAFEVFVDDELVHSRLATGDFPTGADILRALAKHGLT
ncbi:unnamed protein product, partial [Phaeothamnion confervicola]